MKLEIEELQSKLESILYERNVEFSTDVDENTKTYTVKTQEAKFRAIIGPRWIGYELVVDPSVIGKNMGAAEDTDNYPIDGQHSEISLKIFDELKECISGLLEQRILIGKVDEQVVLAIPRSKTTYHVEYFKFRKQWWQLFDSATSTSMTNSEVGLIKELKPLK